MTIRIRHRLLETLAVIALVIAVPATLRRDSLLAQLQSALGGSVPGGALAAANLTPQGFLTRNETSDYFGSTLDAWDGTVAVGSSVYGLPRLDVYDYDSDQMSYVLAYSYQGQFPEKPADIVLSSNLEMLFSSGGQVAVGHRSSKFAPFDVSGFVTVPHWIEGENPAFCESTAFSFDWVWPHLVVGQHSCSPAPAGKALYYNCVTFHSCTAPIRLHCNIEDSTCADDVAAACSPGDPVCNIELKGTLGDYNYRCTVGNCTLTGAYLAENVGGALDCERSGDTSTCMMARNDGWDLLSKSPTGDVTLLAHHPSTINGTSAALDDPFAAVGSVPFQRALLWTRLAGNYTLTHDILPGGATGEYGHRVAIDPIRGGTRPDLFVSDPYRDPNQEPVAGRVYYYKLPAVVDPTATPTPTMTLFANFTSTPTPTMTVFGNFTSTPTPTMTLFANSTITPTPTATSKPGGIDDIDGDGQIEALIDGLLKLRFMFGFRGGILTAGAVDTQHCQRCTGQAIASYLTSILGQLDIDGDAEVHPLTDGLLNLRYLYGFRGTTLTTGAVDLAHCTRCSAAQIEPYIAGLVATPTPPP